MTNYPYCPGPGDEATWGPVVSPLDPRWEDDDEEDLVEDPIDGSWDLENEEWHDD